MLILNLAVQDSTVCKKVLPPNHAAGFPSLVYRGHLAVRLGSLSAAHGYDEKREEKQYQICPNQPERLEKTPRER